MELLSFEMPNAEYCVQLGGPNFAGNSRLSFCISAVQRNGQFPQNLIFKHNKINWLDTFWKSHDLRKFRWQRRPKASAWFSRKKQYHIANICFLWNSIFPLLNLYVFDKEKSGFVWYTIRLQVKTPLVYIYLFLEN